MRIAISGASGLVGSALAASLASDGHAVLPLVRPQSLPTPDGIAWDPERGAIEAAKLEGVDAVVHLAGENIASGRWTKERKRRIRDSRVQGTRLVAEAIAKLAARPPVLFCASAIGYYGPRGDKVLDEASSSGDGFLADVCRAWEQSADAARAAGVRVVHGRFGVILSPDGGALARLLTPFRMGVAGRLGSGHQWMSWITLDDTVNAIRRCLDDARLVGAVNVVAPAPVTNEEFTRTLGRVLAKPTFVGMPDWLLRFALGEMAHELLLSGQRVAPRRLESVGHAFRDPALEPALRRILPPR
jgi:uncharacterized protein